MAPVTIVTDTTHYLPRELVERHGIVEVSLYVNWRRRTERESEHADFDAFYERLRTAPDLPTTSQPSVGDFLAVYEPLLAAGHDDRLAALSPADLRHVRVRPPGRRPARRAARLRQITVIDSRDRCGGLGLVAPRRRRGAAAGGDRDQIAARIREARDALKPSGSPSTRSSSCGAAGASARRRHGSAGRSRSSRSSRSSARSRRSSASAPRAAPSSGWSSTCACCARTAPTAGSSSTSRRPSRPRAGRARPRDLRQRAALRLGDRPGHRHPRRPRPARRRRPPARAGRVAGQARLGVAQRACRRLGHARHPPRRRQRDRRRMRHQSRTTIWIDAATGIATSAPSTPSSVAPIRIDDDDQERMDVDRAPVDDGWMHVVLDLLVDDATDGPDDRGRREVVEQRDDGDDQRRRSSRRRAGSGRGRPTAPRAAPRTGRPGSS